MPIFQLTDELVFPKPELAEENGLLAVGGDLSLERLLLAYSLGIFPWYSEGEPILWWSPSPRLILEPDNFHIPKRLSRTIRSKTFSVTADRAFHQVISACSVTRTGIGEETWITDDMVTAYCKLYELGYAHSVECWQEGKLAGGLYGVSLGRTFFGESMFSITDNSSKVALSKLVPQLRKWNFDMIDCQMKTTHLMKFGAYEISGAEFRKRLERSVQHPVRRGRWDFDD